MQQQLVSKNQKQDNESTSDLESTGIGISYQVNDDLTVSYGSNTRELVGWNDDQEAYAIGAIIHNGIIRYCSVNSTKLIT